MSKMHTKLTKVFLDPLFSTKLWFICQICWASAPMGIPSLDPRDILVRSGLNCAVNGS